MSVGNSRRKKKLFRAISQTFIAIAIVLLQEGSVWALYIQLDPSLAWQLYYEDNIAGDPQNFTGSKLCGFSNRYMPKLEFGLTSSQLSIKGSTQLTVYRYLSEKGYDRTDREYNITGAYKLNPRSEITLSANYTLNSNPERYLTTDAQGFQAGVIVQNTQDETKSYTVNYKYNLSPRNSLILMFDYSTFFSSDYGNAGDLYLYSAAFSRKLSKKDELTVGLGYNHFQFSYGIIDAANLGFKMDNYSINTGIAHEFSDSFKFSFNIGWYIAETKQRQAVVEQDPDTGESIVTGTKTVSNSTPGSNFSFLLEKKYFRTTLQFKVGQALGTNPDNGQTYPSTNISISINHELTDKLRGSCSWSYFNNKATAGEYNNRTNIDNTSYVSGLGLQYQYRRNITFSLQYSRAESNSNSDRNTSSDAIRNTVYLGCTVALQRPFIVR
ncbi:MAG: hypothetical protein NTV89_06015 [Proteobacteria bacterium]|nr:hypothetical protein [Pseudomonadota bacterium]